jgi:hypothetical protein
MSASACGQTFFEIGLFADSFCNRSDAQTIYIQIPNNQTRCSSISPRVFASAVCTSSPPPVAPADTSPGSSSGTASPGVIAGSVVGAIACKRRNYNPAHSLVTFDPNTALSLCLSLIVRVSCRLGVCSVLAAKSVRHLFKCTFTSFFCALLAFLCNAIMILGSLCAKSFMQSVRCSISEAWRKWRGVEEVTAPTIHIRLPCSQRASR